MAARSVMSGRARRGLRRRWRRWRRRCDLLRWRRWRRRNGPQAPSTSIADAACLLPSVPCPVVAVAIALPAPDSVRRELTAMAHLMMRRTMRRRHRLRRRRRRGVRRSKKRHRDGADRSNYETFLAVLHDVVPFFVVETGLFYHISARRARGGGCGCGDRDRGHIFWYNMSHKGWKPESPVETRHCRAAVKAGMRPHPVTSSTLA